MRLDLEEIEKQLRRAHTAVLKGAHDPFDSNRTIAGRTTFVDLADTPETPERAARRRWVHELLQLRIGADLVEDEREAFSREDPDLPKTSPLPRSYEDAFEAFLSASAAVPAEDAFRRMVALANPIASARKERRERRWEAARRLDLDHPWALATENRAELENLARTILDSTEAIAKELLKERGAKSIAAALFDAFARDAIEGWPAFLGGRWFEDLFRVVVPRAPKDVPMPRPLGSASFLRGAFAWGAALRTASTSRVLPFSLSRDPYPTEACLFGSIFAMTIADPSFAKRKLDLSPRVASHHARVTGRVVLQDLRRAAADVLVNDENAEELSVRLWGWPMPRPLDLLFATGGLHSMTIDAPARLLGLVRAHEVLRSFVHRFDEDWFKNPQAQVHLGNMSAGPMWDGAIPTGANLGKLYEERLG